MIGNWQRTLENYWTNTQNETEATLQFVKDDFRCNGLPFDDKFKEYFLRETNDRVAQAYERSLRKAKLEEQLIGIHSRNQELTNKKTTTDESRGTVNNIPNNCNQPATDTIVPSTNETVNTVADWPHLLPSSTPFYFKPRNETFQSFTSPLANNIDPENATGSVEAQVNECQVAISSGIDRNENVVGIDNPIDTTMGSQAPSTSTFMQPTVDFIAPQVVPKVNPEPMAPMNEQQSMQKTTPLHQFSSLDSQNESEVSVPSSDTFQPFTSFLDNNIDPENVTESIEAMIGNESIMTAQINQSQATILTGIEKEKSITTACQAQSASASASIQATNDLLAPVIEPEVIGVNQCSDVNAMKQTTTPLRGLFEAHIIPSDETLQRFASFVCNNIDPNNAAASLGAIIGTMSAKAFESQATHTNGMAVNKYELRNNIEINEMANEMMANAHPDPIISECDDMNALHALKEKAINDDLPNDTMIVDLTTENDGAFPEKADSQTYQKEVKQLTTIQRRKRKNEEPSTSNGNLKKKRKIAPRSTLKTILSESPSIDLRSEESRSVKQSKIAGAQRSQRIKINSNGAEQEKRSISNGKSKTKCEFCNYVARSQSQLIIHTRIHTGEKPFQCKICAKRFTQKITLKTHMRTHANQFPFHCSICRQGFAVKWAKEKHEKNCNQRLYKCYLCKYHTLYKESLVKHMRLHTGDKPFRCSLCSKRFVTKYHMKRHQKRHQNKSK
ncbi:uncharacterized protein LOC116350319 [Contarinia nasturtii]|uniref:uncharacterized protein LOC116350319 n=1 Tax=Contarinia nasturtii TaxID=265458 RepID=UPI0012D39041|nr:uncharacterized protein LOC116350319 [Contarinia nasturtii]XP_031637935.1 uncharacterized protein LOC116350319 [Contarinia nasturtii]